MYCILYAEINNILLYESPSGTICQCCHPSAAFSKSGALAVMWRNWVGGARDLYLVQSADGQHFGQPIKLGSGTWKLNACPMDGGGLAFDGDQVITAWRRQDSIFLDEPGQPETKLGEGKDVAVAAGSGHVDVVWVKGTQLESWISGATRTLAGDAAFPTVTVLSDGSNLVAWEEDGGISLERLP